MALDALRLKTIVHEFSSHLFLQNMSFQQLFDRNNNVTKSITNILRKFVCQEIAVNFTAQKKVVGKTVFKKTRFGRCMKGILKFFKLLYYIFSWANYYMTSFFADALLKFHTFRDGTPINETEVFKCVGYAISNAKDWAGRKRTVKST